jgi:hypothetical protein
MHHRRSSVLFCNRLLVRFLVRAIVLHQHTNHRLDASLASRYSRCSSYLPLIGYRRRKGAEGTRVCSSFEITRVVEIGNQPALLRLPPQHKIEAKVIYPMSSIRKVIYIPSGSWLYVVKCPGSKSQSRIGAEQLARV